MAWNTKNWETRLTEIKTTIRDKPTDVPYRTQLITRIDTALGGMNKAAKQRLSNNLHLKKQKTKQVRNYVRALMFLEHLFMDEPRTFAEIVQANINQPEYLLLSDLKRVIKNLDPAYHPPDLASHRPLLIGISISGGNHPGPGSIGCFVECRENGRAMILGNQHVMKAEHGSQREYSPDIYQKSKGNGGGEAEKVGTWARGILDHRIDAAVAYIDDGIRWVNRTPEGVNLATSNAVVRVGDRVWKRGTASRKTEGRVVSINKASTVPHARFGGDIPFTNQIEVRADEGPFQIPGDSGSALWNEDNQIIGIMHGGGADGGGIATPIEVVFDLMNVRLPG